jgi:hypothetical protein
MKTVKNNFFKWLFHLINKQAKVEKAFEKEEGINLDILKKSFSKLKRWKKEDKGEEEDFNRHRKSIKKIFFDDNNDKINTGVLHLKSVLEDFLIKNEMDNNDLLKHKILFQAAQNHTFHEAYFYHLDKIEEVNNLTQTYSSSYWLDTFQLNYNRFFHPRFEKDKSKIELNNKTYAPKEVIEQSWISLQKFNLTTQIKLACELRIREANYGETFPFDNDIKVLISQIERYSFETLKAAHIYLMLYKWLDFNNLDRVEEFKNTKDKVLKHIDIFPNKEQITILILLLNYAAKLYMNNYSKVGLRFYHECSKFGFDNNIWAKKTALESSLFMNMYDMTYQNHPNFVKQLRTEHTKKIIPTERQWVVDFIDARQLFKEEKYVEALNLVKPLKHHRNYGLTIRKYILMIQCQYEIQQGLEKKTIVWTSNLEDLSDNYAIEQTIRSFIKCIDSTQYFEQAAEEIKNAALGFILFISQISKNPNSVAEIKKELDITQTYARGWLYKFLGS